MQVVLMPAAPAAGTAPQVVTTASVQIPPAKDFFAARKRLYLKIEKARGSKVMAYWTGDRRNMETQIHREVLDIFTEHLDAMFPVKKITLILYTRGGDTLAAWSILNVLRMYCDELEIIVPSKAHSAGTLMCLGADRVIMTKQAQLGPIDPSLTSPLGPIIPGTPNARAPVSVEAVKGYIDFAKTELGIEGAAELAKVLLHLSEKVHPLVLGQIFRARGQIKFLAAELLKHQVKDAKKQTKIINFLCSESGSHDYTINRREAKALGLEVEKPSQEHYEIIKEIYDSLADEMELTNPFDPQGLVARANPAVYAAVRCVVESTALGSHIYESSGTLERFVAPTQQPGITQDQVRDTRKTEGWRKR